MISQIGIFLFGVIAAWLTQQGNERIKKYACIFGLISQPFWFYAAMEANQWGMFLLSFIYTGIWLIGFRNYWVKPAKPTDPIAPTASPPAEGHKEKCACGNSKPKNKTNCFLCDD